MGSYDYEIEVDPRKFFNRKDEAYSLSLRNINGVFLTDKISIGAGIGLENYTQKESQSYHNVFLLFLDARYYFKNTANTFFAYGDAGKSVKIDDVISKGTMFNLGMGYKFMVGDKTAMHGSLGYNDQTISGNPSVTRNRYYGFAVRAGLLF